MTIKAPHEEEILKDLPFLQRKIQQGVLSKQNYLRNIEAEQRNILELEILIKQDLERAAVGKRTRYDKPSLEANIKRLKENIVLFNEKIKEENATIARLNEIMVTLLDDLARKPAEIILDMRKRDFYGNDP